MKAFSLSKVYQLIEPGQVVLLTTADKGKANVGEHAKPGEAVKPILSLIF
jgi:hypothetical protein